MESSTLEAVPHRSDCSTGSDERAYHFLTSGRLHTNVANSNPSSRPGSVGPNVKYETLVDGYEALPRAVAAAFAEAKGEVHRNHRLDSFRREGKGYQLLFVKTETDHRGRTDRKGGSGPKQTVKVNAKQVVLAMPRRSLELVRWEGFEQPAVREMVGAVISQAAFKIFLG